MMQPLLLPRERCARSPCQEQNWTTREREREQSNLWAGWEDRGGRGDLETGQPSIWPSLPPPATFAFAATSISCLPFHFNFGFQLVFKFFLFAPFCIIYCIYFISFTAGAASSFAINFPPHVSVFIACVLNFSIDCRSLLADVQLAFPSWPRPRHPSTRKPSKPAAAVPFLVYINTRSAWMTLLLSPFAPLMPCAPIHIKCPLT